MSLLYSTHTHTHTHTDLFWASEPYNGKLSLKSDTHTKSLHTNIHRVFEESVLEGEQGGERERERGRARGREREGARERGRVKEREGGRKRKREGG